MRALSQILSKSKAKAKAKRSRESDSDSDSAETCSLRRLSLRGNRITDLGAPFLCQILEANESLQWLDLRSTNLRDNGLYLLAQTMNQRKQSNRGVALNTLLLDGNAFGRRSARMWRIVMEDRHSTLLNFDFWPLIVD